MTLVRLRFLPFLWRVFWRVMTVESLAVAALLAQRLPVATPPATANTAAVARSLPSPVPKKQISIVGYYPQWGVYNHYFVGDFVRSHAADRVTQIDYSQANIVNHACVVADPNADLNLVYGAGDSVDGRADDARAPLRGNFHQLQLLRQRYPKLRMTISIEGKRALFEEAGRPENRAAFVQSCVDLFLKGHIAPGVEAGALFDGIDVDWEYPDTQHAEDFMALMAEFRRQMDATRPGLILSIASGAGQKEIEAVDWRRVSQSVDQIGVMTYDYNGPWSHTTGLLAPLRAIGLQTETASTTMNGYLQAGVPPGKLLLGVPFYAYEWNSVAEGTTHGLEQDGTPVRNNLNQTAAEALLAVSPKAAVYRDPVSQSPWIFDGEEFLTFEDPVSLHEKVNFVQEKHLGGVMIWELSGDAADGRLLRALSAPADSPVPVRLVPPVAKASSGGLQ